MNCFNHYDTIAVGTCQDCQKGLCQPCASKYSFPICSMCNGNRIKTEESKIKKELLLTYGFGIIFATITLFISPGDSDSSAVYNFFLKSIVFFWMAFTFASIIAGWKTLNSLTSGYFLFLPIIGWVIYFGIKLILAITIGWVMLPIRSFKNFRRLKELKSIPL